jgi:hypothetical protein
MSLVKKNDVELADPPAVKRVKLQHDEEIEDSVVPSKPSGLLAWLSSQDSAKTHPFVRWLKKVLRTVYVWVDWWFHEFSPWVRWLFFDIVTAVFARLLVKRFGAKLESFFEFIGVF